MNVNDVLLDAYDRLPDLVRTAVDGLTPAQLRWAPAPGANPIGWLVWHLTRIQDHHIAELLDTDQIWVTGDWAGHFGLAPDPSDTGYGHTAEQLAAVRPDSAEVLVGYYDAVAARTRDFLRELKPADLDRIVDERWDPPVSLGVRLVSVVDDDLQHAGQAAYVRGLLGRQTAAAPH
ncbi:mycothiol transferase [Planosporangium sp. 12N6]|uniref:mycothiol transferase n=1 Tax=Planosporangium spinosum TaxID=3402278 RepID=UPI003CF4F5B2